MKYLSFSIAFVFSILIVDYYVNAISFSHIDYQIFVITFSVTFIASLFLYQYVNIKPTNSLLIATSIYILSIPLLRTLFVIGINKIFIPISCISIASFFMGRFFFFQLCEIEKKIYFLLLSFLITILISGIVNFLINFYDYIKLSFIVSFLLLILVSYIFYINRQKVLILSLVFTLIFTLVLTFYAESTIKKSSNEVLLEKQFNNKKLVLIEKRPPKNSIPAIPQHEAYLNGFEILNSSNDHLKQNCLINTPLNILSLANIKPKTALILGEELGLVTRNLILSQNIKEISVVIEKELFSIAKNLSILRMYNLDSLTHNKTKVFTKDPFYWNSTKKYDLIILNFLPPYNSWYERFYMNEFYSKIIKLLSKSGILVIKFISMPPSISKILNNKNSLIFKQNKDLFLITSKNVNLREHFLHSKKNLCKKNMLQPKNIISAISDTTSNYNRKISSVFILK